MDEVERIAAVILAHQGGVRFVDDKWVPDCQMNDVESGAYTSMNEAYDAFCIHVAEALLAEDIGDKEQTLRDAADKMFLGGSVSRSYNIHDVHEGYVEAEEDARRWLRTEAIWELKNDKV